jgi:pilus assembly protein CpaE
MPTGEKIRVMIVDDVSETRENVRKLLQFEADVDVVGAARTGKEAIQLSQDLNPDVVLMDINMPDMDGISATEQIRAKQPAVQVVILSVQGDQNYMRRAMLAGARDFLTKPPLGDELISAIRRAGSMAQSEQGKNTIVDISPRVEELDREIVEDVMIKHAASGLRILAAPSRPEHAEKVTGGQFTKVLEYLRHMYAYVVVDTATLLTDVTLAAIDISDLLVLVTTQDIPSIKNCRLFLDLSQTLGIERERILFVMNRFDKRINITPDRVTENLKQEVVSVIPFDEQTVTKAVNRGVPFVLDNKNQPAARGIFSLAESVRAHVAAQESAEEPNRVNKR